MHSSITKMVDGVEQVFYLVPRPSYLVMKKQEVLARSRKAKIDSLFSRNQMLESEKNKIRNYLLLNVERIDNMIDAITESINEQIVIK